MLSAAERGNNIELENAQNLCKWLEVDFDIYFDKIIAEKPYAKESVVKYKRILSAILASAKRQRLIEHNFASSDYVMAIQGQKKEIEILNDNEARTLKKALDNEADIRHKTSLYIILFMGIRRGELAGLEWKDIDFEKKTMRIERSIYDIQGYGLITKDPKTYTSKRTLTMPDKLIDVLVAYKNWYLTRKAALGDLWEKTDRLFINDLGESISPSTYRVWLHKILEHEGLKHVTLHSLRHTNITLQLIAGVDLKTVSVRAGHARASTTSDIYSHFIKNSDSHASKVIDNLFSDEQPSS